MFELNYRIVHSDYDDFIGQNGFFKIRCNGYDYGEIYPKEIESVMEKVSLYDWFERLARVINNLATKEYVALSDVESYNTWIEFRKINQNVIISIIHAEKEEGTHDLELYLKESKPGKWTNQVISFNELKNEVIKKGSEYIKYILSNNVENALFDEIVQRFKEIL